MIESKLFQGFEGCRQLGPNNTVFFMMKYTIHLIYFSDQFQYSSGWVPESALFSGWVRLPVKKRPKSVPSCKKRCWWQEDYTKWKPLFDEHSIEIPFPHHTIYLGEPKEGSAPALQIHLEGRNSNPTEGKE
jgi:hypothetical protein